VLKVVKLVLVLVVSILLVHKLQSTTILVTKETICKPKKQAKLLLSSILAFLLAKTST
jgi:hypothetical protein